MPSERRQRRDDRDPDGYDDECVEHDFSLSKLLLDIAPATVGTVPLLLFSWSRRGRRSSGSVVATSGGVAFSPTSLVVPDLDWCRIG